MTSVAEERELALGVMHDPQFLLRASESDVRGHHFDKKFFGWIWDASVNYFRDERYGGKPIEPWILKRLLERDSRIDEQSMARFGRLIDRMAVMRPKNPEFAFTSIEGFSLRNAFVRELERAATDIERNTDIEDVIEHMASFSTRKRRQKRVDYEIVDYLATFEDRQQEREYYRNHPEVRRCFRFGIPELDRRIPRGVMPGMMFSILAKTGIGKSIFLNHCGVQGAIQGLDVTHIITENEVEQIAGRYDARITGIPYNMLQLFDFDGENIRYLRQANAMFNLFRDVVRARIQIVKCVPHQFTVLTIARIYEELKKKGHDTKLLVVDSPDYMLPLTKFQEYRLRQAAAYWELNTFLLENHLIGAVSTHLKASASDYPTAEDTAEAYDKARLMSLMMAMVRAAKQRVLGEMELHFLKARDSDNDPKPVKTKPDLTRMIVDVQ